MKNQEHKASLQDFRRIALLVYVLVACGGIGTKAVADSPAQVITPKGWSVGWYHWETSEQMLLCYTPIPENSQRRLVRWNIKTGKMTPLKLPKYENIPGTLEHYGLRSCPVSPDGKWLLIPFRGYAALEINGTKWVEWGELIGWDVFWSPDSQACVEWEDYTRKGRARVHYLSAAKERKQRRQADVPVLGRTLIGFLSADTLLFLRKSYGSDPNLLVCETVSLQGKVQAKWTFEVPLIVSKYRRVVTLSPDLKQVCWLALRYQADLPWDFVEAHFWISDVAGKNFRPLATLLSSKTGDIADYKDDGLWPYGIQWVPGGSGISFLQEGRIWTLPLPH